jgi:hypothetical protein
VAEAACGDAPCGGGPCAGGDKEAAADICARAAGRLPQPHAAVPHPAQVVRAQARGDRSISQQGAELVKNFRAGMAPKHSCSLATVMPE